MSGARFVNSSWFLQSFYSSECAEVNRCVTLSSPSLSTVYADAGGHSEAKGLFATCLGEVDGS